MPSVSKYMNQAHGWEKVEKAIEANLQEAPHLEASLPILRGLIEKVRSLSVQQASLTASKQQVTRDLRRALREGNATADFLKTAARAHFGSENEKLVEFGIQPFRGRPRAAGPVEPNPPADPSELKP